MYSVRFVHSHRYIFIGTRYKVLRTTYNWSAYIDNGITRLHQVSSIFIYWIIIDKVMDKTLNARNLYSSLHTIKDENSKLGIICAFHFFFDCHFRPKLTKDWRPIGWVLTVWLHPVHARDTFWSSRNRKWMIFHYKTCFLYRQWVNAVRKFSQWVNAVFYWYCNSVLSYRHWFITI